MSHPVSPLAPKTVPDMPEIAGVRLATAEAGIKYRGRTDVLLALLDEGTTVAGVLTRSRCPSAAIDWCRARLPGGRARVLVVNSGNANAFTGLKGREATSLTATIAAAAAGCTPKDVLLASTGVIGEPLDGRKFEGVLATCAAKAEAGGWLAAARAIMTTDTFPKVATRTVRLGDTEIRINGMAKGAGMIAPDMATMLSFVFTDAAVAAPLLQEMLAEGAGKSFNCVTIDGDTSTSDTLLAFATGAAGAPTLERAGDAGAGAVREALHSLLIDLAQQVARDGEGARKLVTVEVAGAESDRSAHRIAMSIANSPLVKTAIAGEDANWGRVVMAIGKAGEPADRDRIAISFGDVRVAVDGERDPAYSEDAASAAMKKDEVTIRVELGLGGGTARVWTCDLTKAYVEINGDYRS